MTLHSSIIDSLPAGIDRAILRILSFRVGEENAISRDDLIAEIFRNYHISKNERTIRERINHWRNQGWRICSKGGEGGGYWMAKSEKEIDQFCRQHKSRSLNMLHQVSMIKKMPDPDMQISFG